MRSITTSLPAAVSNQTRREPALLAALKSNGRSRFARSLHLFCLAATVLISALSTSRSAAQTFVAEWTGPADGGIAPTGTLLSTEAGVTYLYVCDNTHNRVVKFN